MRVTVVSTVDRDEAQVLVSMLRSAGIEAELIGVVDAARIGVGESALPLRIEVEQEDEAEARELIAAPRQPAPQEDEGPPPLSRKRPIIALGVPLVWPGLAHIYATRPFTGGALAIGAVIAILSGELAGAVPLLMIFDAFFGRRAVLAFNRGQHVGAGRQLLAGIPMVVIALGLVGARAFTNALERRASERELSNVKFTCTQDDAIFTNVGDAARDLEVLSVEDAPELITLDGQEAPGAVLAGGARQVVQPGESIRRPLRKEPTTLFELAPPRHNSLRARIVVRKESTDPGIHGRAWCSPR
ncbi:MAG: DUF2007 domain-containing protein [Archangium sp.]|nr:DUF2007 domain-containing protein [Archangium sp.]